MVAEPDTGDEDAGDATRTAGLDLRVPDSATREEAAAIAAAIEAYLAGERAAETDREGAWTGRRWPLAGRLDRLIGCRRRVPTGAPPDGWSAAGRADRF